MRTMAGRAVTALAGSELLAWIALRRVCRGELARIGDRYLDQGRPVPGYLQATLEALARAGLVSLAEADPEAGALQRVGLTEAGRIQYAALCLRAGGGVR